MSCLQVFAKAPLPGQVKTRLQPALPPQQCAQLHQSLLLQTLQTASKAQQTKLQLWCHPDTRHPFFAEMRDRFQLELHSQQGRDLGERMCNAVNQGLHSDDVVILIGSDCPFFTRDYLNKAFHLLNSDLDFVFGPAEDGGFVLLGTNKPIAEKFFQGISWGKNTTLQETLQRVEQNEMQYVALQPLRDIDRPEDLELID